MEPFRSGGTTQKAGLVADDMVIAFKNIVEGFGDRLDHILRNIFLVLSSLPGCTLLDAYNVLRSGTPASEELRARILQRTDNGLARNFWAHDFEKYRDDDLSPLRNKLGKLLLAGPASLMLSQPENAFHLGEVMNEGKILLVNLSRIGSQVRGIVGSLLLSQFCQETLRRSEIPVAERREFFLYCDEAQHFATDLLLDLIAKARRYDVGLTLAHQNMRRFDPREHYALSSVVSTIVFTVDQANAEYLTEDLLNVVRTEDLISQPNFQAVARIGRKVVRIHTHKPPDITGTGHRDGIIERSRRLYCKPVAEVVATIRRRSAESG